MSGLTLSQVNEKLSVERAGGTYEIPGRPKDNDEKPRTEPKLLTVRHPTWNLKN